MDIEILRQKLAEYGQEHLLAFSNELNPEELKELFKEINELNLNEVINFFECTTNVSSSNDTLNDRLEPVPPEIYGSVSRTPPEILKQYESLGLSEISKGNVGVLLLAGGQGTRLGVTYPKGMFDVGLPSHKTLYQLQAERIRKLEILSGEKFAGTNGKISWYIMTSEHTKDPTLEFFAKNNYFGLKKENLIVFEQGMLPCFTFDGKIILENKYKIAKAPDGNGGLYRALKENKILDDFEKRGVKYLYVYCVDNILVKIADPIFIGYCLTKNADCGNKTVEKSSPTEAVGVVCKVDGKYQVVEYSEISLKTAQLRNQDGSLLFSAGNICNHLFSTQFLRKVADNNEYLLKHHIAKKKIPTIDDSGNELLPNKANGIKMEKFVFDVFQFSENFAVWDVIREDEFSPLKNSEGADKDTPTTARNDLFRLHERYIRSAGGMFVADTETETHKINGSINGVIMENGHEPKINEVIVCEISPLLSYAGEGLTDLVAGKKLHSPLILMSNEEKQDKVI